MLQTNDTMATGEITKVAGGTANEVQRMTSLEIAEVAGKQHKDVMRAINLFELFRKS